MAFNWKLNIDFTVFTTRNALLIGTAATGAILVGTVVYGAYKRVTSTSAPKTCPFKVIKPPTKRVGLESKRAVAVVGSTGFVGSHVVEKLIETGDYRVYMLGRRFNEDNINPRADAVFQVDMMDYSSLEKAFEGVDTVILSAVVIPTVYSTAEQVYRLNVTGAQNVVNAAKSTGVRNLIFISGIQLVHEQRNKVARSMVTAFNDIEQLFIDANQHKNMNACVLAFCQIYGTRSSYYNAILKGQVSYFPFLDFRATFIPVEFVAEVVVKAERKLEEEDTLVAGRVLNVTGAPSSMKQFMTHPSLGVTIRHVPMRIVDWMAWINMSIAMVTGRAPFGAEMSPAMTSFFQMSEQTYDTTIAQEALGIGEPPSLDQGIPQMVAKFREAQEVERSRSSNH